MSRLLCVIGFHDWQHETMSMEVYANKFMWRWRCRLMKFVNRP